MARHVPILIAVLIALGLGYLLFRRRDVGEPVHGSARTEAARATSAPQIEQVAEPVRAGSERESAAVPLAEARSGSVLAVLVVANEDRRPLAGIRLTVFPKDPKPGSSSRDVDGNRGTIDTAPRTDSTGHAEFELPAGVELKLSARAEDNSSRTAYLDVPTLELGIRRELTIEMLTQDDVLFHGQVFAREDRHPIAMAKVHVVIWAHGRSNSPPTRDSTTDSDGRFQLELASWMAPWASISAEGFAAALVAPTSGRETRESAQQILLDRSATLQFHLLGSNGPPLSETTIRASTASYHVQQPEGAELSGLMLPDPNWSGDTDVDGRCTLSGLPPGAPLHVEVLRKGKSLRKEAEAITLRPGEAREIEWTIGIGCRLSGRVTDSKNNPVAGLDLWVLGAESKDEYLEAYAERRVVGRAKTDEQGRYHVDDLSAGRLLVGPAPSKIYADPPREDAIAPLAVHVEIPEGAREVERDLVVHRGLYIRGHVLDPDGAPAPQVPVMASNEESTLHQSARGTVDGSFALGPLAPGVFQLRAMGSGKYANSERVSASAGDDGVILRLSAAGSVVGTVVDAVTGLPCSAMVTLSSKDPAIAMLTFKSTGKEGSFQFESLQPGAYDVSASTEGGRSGTLAGVAVVARSASDGLVVRVAPGAKVIIRYEGKATWGSFSLESGGVLVASDNLRSGTSSTRVVPAGHVVMKFQLWNPKSSQEKELDLAVGEEKVIAFGDG